MNEIPQRPRRAIALEYDGHAAPRVTATGADLLAEQIIAIARESDVPLFENPELAQVLSQLELGDEIPELLYLCIAQVIAFAYFIRGRVPDGWRAGEQSDETSYGEDFTVPSDPILPTPDH